MKELKFRAFDKLTKKMSPAFALFGEFTLVGAVHSWQHEEAEAIGILHRDSLGRLNDLEVMQSTGLEDKNGTPIFEGDVIRTYMGNVCEIQWGHVLEKTGQEVFEYTGFCFHHIKQDKNYHLDVTTSCEIIGNIYQNPELLEK